MDLNQYFDRIDQYETGALSPADSAAFEAELQANAELREALALYRQAGEVIEQQIENNLRAQLETWAAAEQATAPPTGKVVPMRLTWIRWAAAAGVALLLGWFGFQWAGRQYTDQALYANYYEKPADSAFRSGSATEQVLQPGFDALQKGDWAAAQAFFSGITPGQERYAEAQFYLGHAALQVGQYDTAAAAFERCAAQGEPKFQEKAEWNQALALLAAGQTETPAFKTLLARIANSPNHSFATQAQALQQQLASFWRGNVKGKM